MTYNKIKEALPHMNPKVRKIVVNAKIRGQINMYLPLFLNQTQQVQNQCEVMLMRINKMIDGQKYFRTENEKICNRIKMPLPKQEIVNSSAKFIQKLIHDRKTPAIMERITRTKRVTSKFYHIYPKKKIYKTPLEVLINLYNQISNELKHEKPKTFKRKLKKEKIDYNPEK